MKTAPFVKLAVLLLVLTSIVSCGGQKPMVTDIDVRPYYQNSDVHIQLSSTLALGNVTLPGISLPVILPHNGQNIGSIQMQTVLGGQNIISIDVNLTEVAKVQAQTARLPNGNIIPLIGNNQVIVIPIQNKVNLYLTMGNGVAALGVDIPFSTLDAVGDRVGNISIFPIFNIKGVLGSAGLYFSRDRGKNGFGLFADLTNVLDDVMFLDLGEAKELASLEVAQKSFAMVRSWSPPVRLDYRSINPSKRSKERIDKELYKLHRSSKRLRLH